MTEPSNITGLIFGHDTEPPACASCAGVGLTGVGDAEMPALCERCGGSGFGNILDLDPIDDGRQLRLDLDDEDAGEFDGPIFDPAFVARCRPSMSETELDEAAIEFSDALLQGIADIERLLEAGDLPLASVRRPEAG